MGLIKFIQSLNTNAKIYFLLLKPRVIKLFLPIKIFTSKVRYNQNEK